MTWRVLCACLAFGALQCAAESRLPAGASGRAGNDAGANAGSDAGAGRAGSSGAGAGGAGVGGQAGTAGNPFWVGPPDAEALLAASCRLDLRYGELLPANILFVLDRSASMACNPPPVTDSVTCEETARRELLEVESKWEIVQGALIESLRILPEDSRVGVSYFSNDEGCGVQSSPFVQMNRNSAQQKDVINISLSRVSPRGPTPLVGATILAYQYLHGLAKDGLIRGNNFVVLLTDGKQSPQCGDAGRCTTADECTELLIETEVPKAAGPGVWIRTFVIGVPGSELDRRTLSRIAVAGGTKRADCDPDRDCHFDVSSGGNFSEALRQALQDIVGQTRSCDLSAPLASEGSRDRVNLLYKPLNRPRIVVPQDNRPCEGGANGWQYADNDTRIRLCGDVCSQLQADPEGLLQIVTGCPVVGPE